MEGVSGSGSGFGASEMVGEVRCPRCESNNTKFCYYNNYNMSQPRHLCKACRRYWTKGGALRNIPVGGASRKSNKRTASSSSSKRTSSSSTTSSSSSSSSHTPNLQLGPTSADAQGQVLLRIAPIHIQNGNTQTTPFPSWTPTPTSTNVSNASPDLPFHTPHSTFQKDTH